MSTIQISSQAEPDRPKLDLGGSIAALAASVAMTALLGVASPAQAQTQPQPPNIVVIWGDDIGQSDISAYSHGLMGFKTPNIDRIAKRRHDVHRLLR